MDLKFKKSWKIHPPHLDEHKTADEVGIHPVVAGILLRRGHSSASAIRQFVKPSLDLLESPDAYVDMPKAVERIKRAIQSQEKILVYGDYDVDGVTGSAILYPVLKKMGADVDVHIPHRLKEGYGLNLKTLEKLLEKKITLVITVDNGIASAEAIRYISEKGADVIIVDHHTPKDEMPVAYAIISAVKEGKGDPNLAACGLAFKVAWALLGSLEAAKEYLDLVVLGTVADLAPVLGDNRMLLKIGLPILAAAGRPGIRALMDVSSLSRNAVSYRDIAFGLGPRINASGRMGSPMTAFKLLTTDSLMEARNLAQLLDEGNRDRQRAEADAFEQAVKKIEADPEFKAHKILVLESPDWHEGVLGIIAARLVERYQKPAIVISIKGGSGKGSGRSILTHSIYATVLKCESLLTSFGGHAQACGLSIQADKVGEFRRKLNEAALESGDSLAIADVWVEAEVGPEDLDSRFLRDLEKLEPYGPGNPRPYFISKSLRVRGEVKKRGRDTLQCWMTDKEGKTTCEVVGFRAYERWRSEAQKKEMVDIIYQPSLKTYKGITSIELQLEDWR